MSSLLLWIDSEHAKIFRFSPEGMQKQEMKRAEPDHHTHPHKEDHNSEHFFHQVAESLKSAKEIIIAGPGLAKTHFKTHLEKHHHGNIAKNVIAMETMDHLTDPQIEATGRKFFKHAHLFS